MVKSLERLCACGCGGKLLGRAKKYLKGHQFKDPEWVRNNNAKKRLGSASYAKVKLAERSRLCACGCGGVVTSRSRHVRYLRNHQYADPKFKTFMHGVCNDPKRRRKISLARTLHFSDPDNQEKQSKALKRVWADPEYKAMREVIRMDPVYKQLRKKLAADPEYRNKLSDKMSEVWSCSKRRSKQSDVQNARWVDSELRQQVSERTSSFFACPATRLKASELSLKLWQDPEYRLKCVIARHSGGSTIENINWLFFAAAMETNNIQSN